MISQNKCLISITTFQKSDALSVLLNYKIFKILNN